MRIYSVCVGNYERISDSKKAEKQLLDMGYKSYPFNKKGYYTLKVLTTPNRDKAFFLKQYLENKGFEVTVE